MRRCSPSSSCSSSPTTASSLGSFAMSPAFPASDSYGPSAPSPRHQQTTCLAAADLADRQVGDEQTVPTFTTDQSTGSVSSFSPAGMSTATPQSFTVAPGTNSTEALLPGCQGVRRTALPAIHQVSSRSNALEGVPPLVPSFVHLSVLLAGPGLSGSANPSRRCRGCSHLPSRLRGQAASRFSGLLRPAGGGALPPPVMWRLVAHPAVGGLEDHLDLQRPGAQGGLMNRREINARQD